MKGLKTIKKKTGMLTNRLLKLCTFQYLYLTAILIFVLPLQSCYYDVIVTDDQSQSTEVSLKNNVLPIFNTTCITCHNGVTALPNLTAGSAYNELISGNYVNITTPENSILIKKIRSGHPYEGALTETEINRLVRWIEEGALDN